MKYQIVGNFHFKHFCCYNTSMDKDWKENNDKLEKTFKFENFSDAMVFLNRVGEIAEEMNHHPDICIQNYNEVLVSTTTHSEGNNVTKKDRKLASAIDSI